MSTEHPRVFISYSWESDSLSDPHRAWVRHLAEQLETVGIEVKLDQWRVNPGDSFTQFMEESVAASDFTLMVLTPNYAIKANGRTGGVGYEQQIVSGQIVTGTARSKFIPLIRTGLPTSGPEGVIPTAFLGIAYIDFRNDECFKDKFDELVRTIYRKPEFAAPSRGAPPPLETRTKTSIAIKPEGNTSPQWLPTISLSSTAKKVRGISKRWANWGIAGRRVSLEPFFLAQWVISNIVTWIIFGASLGAFINFIFITVLEICVLGPARFTRDFSKNAKASLKARLAGAVAGAVVLAAIGYLIKGSASLLAVAYGSLLGLFHGPYLVAEGVRSNRFDDPPDINLILAIVAFLVYSGSLTFGAIEYGHIATSDPIKTAIFATVFALATGAFGWFTTNAPRT